MGASHDNEPFDHRTGILRHPAKKGSNPMRKIVVAVICVIASTCAAQAAAPLLDYEMVPLIAVAAQNSALDPPVTATALKIDRVHHTVRTCTASRFKNMKVIVECRLTPGFQTSNNVTTSQYVAVPYIAGFQTAGWVWSVDQQSGTVYFCSQAFSAKCLEASNN